MAAYLIGAEEFITVFAYPITMGLCYAVTAIVVKVNNLPLKDCFTDQCMHLPAFSQRNECSALRQAPGQTHAAIE
jgi:hypothetical protein